RLRGGRRLAVPQQPGIPAAGPGQRRVLPGPLRRRRHGGKERRDQGLSRQRRLRRLLRGAGARPGARQPGFRLPHRQGAPGARASLQLLARLLQLRRPERPPLWHGLLTSGGRVTTTLIQTLPAVGYRSSRSTSPYPSAGMTTSGPSLPLRKISFPSTALVTPPYLTRVGLGRGGGAGEVVVLVFGVVGHRSLLGGVLVVIRRTIRAFVLDRRPQRAVASPRPAEGRGGVR